MSKPILHNIRILDFTWVLAGPYATRLLGDFGAEVIKVQPLLPQEDNDAFARGYYNTWNRNKLGITLNLSKPEGISLAKKLAAVSDAVVENFTPRVMANFGLDYENLKKIKPDIIMVSLSVMGQKNPESFYTGYAPTVHALSGMTGLMKIDDRPVGPGVSYADHVAGLFASMSLLAALEKRRQTGEGQHIDISDVDLVASLLGEKETPKKLEKVFLCKDGKWCAVTVETDVQLNALGKLVGVGEELAIRLGEWMRNHTAAEAMAILQKNGIAAGIVQDAAALAHDSQLKSRDFFKKSRDISFIDASPVRTELQPERYKRAPAPGEDNEYVYSRLLGLSHAEIEELRNKGVI